jgi:hypothetical protein
MVATRKSGAAADAQANGGTANGNRVALPNGNAKLGNGGTASHEGRHKPEYEVQHGAIQKEEQSMLPAARHLRDG